MKTSMAPRQRRHCLGEQRQTEDAALALLQVVDLTEDRPGDDLRQGMAGTVVDLPDGSGWAYEVETAADPGRATFLGRLPIFRSARPGDFCPGRTT